MRIFFLLPLVTLLLVTSISIAQDGNGKYTDKLKQLYFDKEYTKIIEFKPKKEKEMSSNSLFFKGMAHYLTENDLKAIQYLDMAIEKGPASADMYYYKAMCMYYLEDHEGATPNFNKAKEMLPGEPDFWLYTAHNYMRQEMYDSAVYNYKRACLLEKDNPKLKIYLAGAYHDMKNYEKALKAYQDAFDMLKTKSNRYQNTLYNIGLCQFKLDRYEDAEKTFEDLIDIFPEDYHGVAKLIQVKYALGKYSETVVLKEILRDHRKDENFPTHMTDKFCTAQMKWNGDKVHVWERYENDDEQLFPWWHKSHVSDDDAQVYKKVISILDTIQLKENGKEVYHLYKIEDDSLYKYGHYSYSKGYDYKEYEQAVLQVLNDEVQPVKNVGSFSAYEDELRTAKYGSLGTTYSTAIAVESVADEYKWLRKHYPGYTFLQQTLLEKDGKWYDRLDIKTANGDDRSIFFDISSFFGKW